MSDSTFSGKPMTLTGKLDDPRLSSQVLDDGSIVKYLRTRLTADQEIRARALECAVRCHAMRDSVEQDVIFTAKEFEDYIRNGR